MPLDCVPRYVDFSFFESLTQLRAIEIQTLDKRVLSSIAQYCKNLEHVDIWDNYKGKGDISAAEHSNLMRILTLPHLCSFSLWAAKYSKDQTNELVTQLAANQNLEYIEVKTTKAPLEPEVLYSLLRRCTKIKSIGMDFDLSDVNPQLCQVVDELDEVNKNPHSIVEVQCGSMGVKSLKRAKNNRKSYKWLRFVPKISPPAVLEKWQYGSLSAGKP
ncbi:hypothetical protein Ddc_10564 [Ditylenchus destructor]|nr:hypothetical protein Ddc_10564 [Ditylenchus destructor]